MSHPSPRRSGRARRTLRRPSRIAAWLLASLLGLPLSALASGPGGGGPGGAPGGGPDGWSLSLGAVVMSKQDAYIGVGRDTLVLPLIRFDSEWVEIAGKSIGLKLPSFDLGAAGSLGLQLVADLDFRGYKAKDSAALTGMADRKGGLLGGLRAKWETPLADLSLSVLSDLSGNSKGRSIGLTLERGWHFDSGLMLSPRLGVTDFDDKTVDYYYGVRPSEARAGRPAYRGKSGTEVEIGLQAVYPISGPHGLYIDASVASLPKSIKDSPIVGRSSTSQVMFGYSYRLR